MRIGLAQLDAGKVDWHHADPFTPYIAAGADAGCTCVIFPELSDSGYDLSVSASADGQYRRILAEMAKEYGIWILAGVRDHGSPRDYNVLYCFSPKGDIVARYEKMHLLPVGNPRENTCFTAGRKGGMVDISGISFGLSICFDLRFPSLYRSYAKVGAAVMIVVSAWPDTRIDDWYLLLQARAVENQAYMVGVNYCGTRGDLHFGGTSAVFGPTGEPVVVAEKDHAGFLKADLDLHKVANMRRLFPVLPYDRGIPGIEHH